MMSNKTIAAIATPAGQGALGVIRISGDNAIEIADKVFFSLSKKKLCDFDGYQAAYGEIKTNDAVLDDAVALVFKAPHSFTGEDTVEITLHGGSLMLKEALRLILENGAFLAEPGEFTKRAFLNGKTDLTRAESIMGLISARNQAELKLSRQAHSGKIWQKIESIENDLVSIDASIAAFSDYPDEDIEGLSLENFNALLKGAEGELRDILANFDAGKLLREGIDTAIVGKPNVGKSTIMNMLSGTDRSIVTEIAGTTRDIIEETVTIGDLTLKLADTAGIHSTNDAVEIIGVDKAKQKIETAQLILAVFDCSAPLSEDDFSLISSLSVENTVVILNKTDIKSNIDLSIFKGFRSVFISAKNGDGYEDLKEQISEISGTANLSAQSIVLINERQRECARRAYEGVKEALLALESGMTVDAIGVCVDDAIAALFEMTGKRVTNEVTDEIFRKFCVGK